MTRVTFEEVTMRRTITYACCTCKKVRTKTLRITHTVNPFNTDESGAVKSRNQVEKDVFKELEQTEKEFDRVCSKCA